MQNYSRSLDKDLYDGVTLLRANGAAQKGKKELAYSLYKNLLKYRESINISIYAWACRGIAITTNPHDPESYKHHEMAADAFLQCGDRLEAAKDIYKMAEFIEASNLENAFKLIEEANNLGSSVLSMLNQQLRCQLSKHLIR